MVHTEAEFVHIGLHVPDGDMMVDSVHTPLDDCPEGFNTVSVLSVTLIGLHAKFPLQLTSGDTFLRNHDKIDCVKPHTNVKMSILKDSPCKNREMGLAVVAEQVTPVVPSITVDVVYAATERAYISAVVLNLDDKINGGLLRWKPLMEIKIVIFLFQPKSMTIYPKSPEFLQR